MYFDLCTGGDIFHEENSATYKILVTKVFLYFQPPSKFLE